YGSWTTTSRASGRPTATTTTAILGGNSGTGATDLARGGGRRRGDRDAAGPDARPGRAGLDRTSRRTARRRSPDLGGRVPGRAELIARLRAAPAARADGLAAPRRRGVAGPWGGR